MAKSEREKLKQSFIDQLAARGDDIALYVDLVEQYMEFWDMNRVLTRDIAERGVVYEDLSSVGVPMTKNNASVNEKSKCSRQMLAILTHLGLKADGTGKRHGDDRL